MSDDSTQYVVTAAAAYFMTAAPDGGERLSLLYAGALVPDTATPESIAHHLDAGLIAPVEPVVLDDPDAAGGSTQLVEPGQGTDVVLEEPARNASTEDWKAFAIAKGATPEDVEALKRDELVELFGTPAGS